MKDGTGGIIYIGKAKKLRNRVRSYFSGEKDVKTRSLVQKIASIDFITTDSEYEALILENNLIKEYSPRYNINLKDGKTYPMIRITNEDFPRIFRTRRMIQDGSAYFGPFPSVKTIELYLDLVDRLHPLRKCRGPLKKRAYPCLYYHIGKCPGPCAGLVGKEEYRKRVDRAAKMLSEPPGKLRDELDAEMRSASSAREFEKAAEYRDLVYTIDAVFSEQKVDDRDAEARDYVGWYTQDGVHGFVVLQMRDGRLTGTDIFQNNGIGEDDEIVLQFLIQFYGMQKSISAGAREPVEAFEADEPDAPAASDGDPPGRGTDTESAVRRRTRGLPHALFVPIPEIVPFVRRFFSEQFGRETRILTAESDRDTAIMQMARENARQDVAKYLFEQGSLPAIEELQRVLGLPDLPVRIEGFDIAQLNGKHTVAAMVSFLNGRADSSSYRSFHIKSLNGQIDDFESIREAVARRYTRVVNEGLPRPNLILIDGGKGQLNAASSILESIGLGGIPILGLAKREEEIFLPGRSDPVTLPAGNAALRVLQAVRDEAHRFGTSFNQRLRSKDIKSQALESIPGIGKLRSQRLLAAFPSIEELTKATAQDVAEAGKFGEPLARTVIETLRRDRAEYGENREGSENEESR